MGGEVVISRVVLYTIADNGWVVPIRKAYKKARFKRKMARYHDWYGFHKNVLKKYIKKKIRKDKVNK